MPFETPELGSSQLWERRTEIASAWARTLHEFCFIPLSDAELQKRLLIFVDQLIDMLLSEQFQTEAARAIGSALAILACPQPEALARTQELLGQQLLSGLLPYEAVAMQSRLATLMAELAMGFTNQMREQLLSQQEQSHRTSLMARNQVEEQLRDERNFYTTVLGMVDALIIVADAEGRIVGFNRACERTSGYRLEEVQGHHFSVLLAPESREKATAHIAQLPARLAGSDNYILHESVWLRRDGSRREIKWSTTALLQESGEVKYLIGTGIDVTEQRRIEAELREVQRQAAQIREAERVRMAQELHDDAVQQLLGLSYKLAEIGQDAATNTPLPQERLEALLPELADVRQEVIAVAQGLRRLITTLRPPGLQELGLRDALEAYVDGCMRSRGRAQLAISLDLQLPESLCLSRSVATCLYRVTQEAIGNAYKHAQAQRLGVSLALEDQELVLVIKDDGCGFDVPDHLHRFGIMNKFGLLGMEERVQTLAGTLTVHSKPGAGTAITARIPLCKGEKSDGETD